jgi:hypothetical protein
VDRVAAKVAQEVVVLFQDDDLNPRTRQQVAQHQPGRAATGNAASGVQLGVNVWT